MIDRSVAPAAVGRVVATELKPSTPHQFHFWTARDCPIGIGAIVRVEQDGRTVLREAVSEIQVPYLARQRPTVRAGHQLLVTVRRISVKSHLRLRISGEVLVELSPGDPGRGRIVGLGKT